VSHLGLGKKRDNEKKAMRNWDKNYPKLRDIIYERPTNSSIPNINGMCPDRQ
jgi:hypothetical protein